MAICWPIARWRSACFLAYSSWRSTISADLRPIRSIQVQTLFEVSRIWQIVADLLNISLGMDEEAYQETIRLATNAARQKFYIRSPKVRQLIDELEQALSDAFASQEEGPG